MKLIIFTAVIFLFLPVWNAYSAEAEIVELTGQQVKELMVEEPALIILDIRTAEEYRAGHLPNALHYDVSSPFFMAGIQELAAGQPDKNWLVYCRSGRRTGEILPYLASIAPRKIYHMQGGLLDWPGQLVP